MNSGPQNPQRVANHLRFSVAIVSLVVLGVLIFGMQKLKSWRVSEDERKQRQHAFDRKKRNHQEQKSATEERTAVLSNRVKTVKSPPPPDVSLSNQLASAESEQHTNAPSTTKPPEQRLTAVVDRRGRSTNIDERTRVARIWKKITENSRERTEADMKQYTAGIPQSSATYSMVVIKGGQFVMGSADSDAQRKADEQPQHPVKISPFWMQECEVTWNEYELFMYPNQGKTTAADLTYGSDGADATARPSKPYVEMSFGMGKDNFPAISMTQHAANKYCEWLSEKLGHFYRLPTEAEWEYACRAGTRTSYYFGDNPENLGEYGWFADNSGEKYQKVRKKKPNAWGLYDMHGNVAEWCLDQYQADYYKQFRDALLDPWNKATRPYPHVVRGGAWSDPAPLCRSAARRGSDKSWKLQDSMIPQSIWYLTDAQFVGFRIVRPLKIPSPNEMYDYWNSGVESDVTRR